MERKKCKRKITINEKQEMVVKQVVLENIKYIHISYSKKEKQETRNRKQKIGNKNVIRRTF